MTLKECAGTITAVGAVIGLAFGAYFYIEARYALSADLQKTNQRLEQKISQDRVNWIQEQLWKIDDRLKAQKRGPTDVEEDQIRRLKMEKEQIDKELGSKK